jgi:hypothetical protein
MSTAVRLLDNQGFNVPPGIVGYTPVLASGQKVTDAATGGDHELALTAGKTYIAMADTTAGGQWLLGIATTATAANVIWFIPVGGVLCFHMPVDYATLHYQALANGSSLYITEVDT